MISIPKPPPTPYHIGDFVKSPLWDEWYDPISADDKKMENATTFSAPFERSLLQQGIKILHTSISFRLNTTDIESKYDQYSRKFADG